MNRFFGGAVGQNSGVQAMNNSYGQYMRPINPGYQVNPGGYYQNGVPAQNMQSSWPQQTMQQNIQPQQAMIPNQTNIIWVENEDEISRYPTGKGWQQWFGNKNDSILYIRDTDANGVIQPIAKLRYEVIEDTPAPSNNPAPQVASTYDGPSREEFNKLNETVNSILSKIEEFMK